MATRKLRVAVIQLSGHDKVVRSYIELRALYEAFAKAKKVAGGFKLTGSTSYWDDMRSKVENHQRSELRKIYERDVKQKLTDVLAKCKKEGIGPYVKYMCDLNQGALTYRRQLDELICDDIEYARSNEKLFGVLGRLAVVTKLGADIILSVLGTLPGASFFVDLGYSGATDLISTVSSTKDADLYCIQGTATTLVVAGGSWAAEKGMELDKGAVKVMKWSAAIAAITAALVAADKDWQKFQ